MEGHQIESDKEQEGTLGWISPELVDEYRAQFTASGCNSNGCDVTLTTLDKNTMQAHGMILAAQSPIFRRSLRQAQLVSCRWGESITRALLDYLYGCDAKRLESNHFLVELLLCSTYYQVEWLCRKLSDALVFRIKRSSPQTDEEYLDFCYKLVILLQDMDHSERKPYDPLVAPLFEFCCNRIRAMATDSNFPTELIVNDTVENIINSTTTVDTDQSGTDPLNLILCFYPGDISIGITETEMATLRNTLRYQLISRICITQQMMLDAVKHAQRQFPTKLYYKEEAAALIVIGDKVIQEDNVAEKYFHSRHNGIGHVVSFCSKMSTGIGCGGCSKHLYVDWGDQRCWCRMGYENLYELKLLR